MGSWAEPGPHGTRPASAACAFLPALAAQRAGRLQGGPGAQRPGPGLGPALPGSRGGLPAAPSLRPGDDSSVGGSGVRDSRRGRRGRFSSRDEESWTVAWGNSQGQAGATQRPAPPPGRGRDRGPSEQNTDCTWDHPAKKGCRFSETKQFQLCVQSVRLNDALDQHLSPAQQHVQGHLDRRESSVTLPGRRPQPSENSEVPLAHPHPQQGRDSRGTRQLPRAQQE